MNKAERDNPGVIAPPPLIFLGGLLAGGAVDLLIYAVRIVPAGYLTAARAAGGLLILGGLALVLVVRRQMSRAGTNIEPWKPTERIITGGLYARSRNPVYAALVLIYLGAVVVFNSLWMLLFLAPVLGLIRYGVIAREERYLERKFGEEYLDYRERVGRWM